MAHGELVRRAFEAFNRGDLQALRLISSPNVRIVPLRAALEDTAYTGPDAIDDFWADATSAWSDQNVEIEEVESEGDRAVARGVLRSTARGSGAPVETRATWTFTFRDGLIEEIETRAEA
jgi:ketosteroid isomerase-like protein